MTTRTQSYYDAESGRLVEFLGRVAIEIRLHARRIHPSSTYPESEREAAAFCLYTYADMTHNVEGLGRAIAFGDHGHVEFLGEMLERECAHYIEEQKNPTSPAARYLSKHLIVEGRAVLEAITSRARQLKELNSAAA